MTRGQRYTVFVEVLIDGIVIEALHEGMLGSEMEAMRYELSNKGPELLTFDVKRE